MDLPHQRANGVYAEPRSSGARHSDGAALGPGSGDKGIVLGLYLVFEDDYPCHITL